MLGDIKAVTYLIPDMCNHIQMVIVMRAKAKAEAEAAAAAAAEANCLMSLMCRITEC